MELIDKSALVVEIEKYYNECLKRAKITDSDYWNAKADAYRNILVILNDTLEVKEIDFSKCYHEFLQREWFGNSHVRTISEMMAFTAKYFFELGIKNTEEPVSKNRFTFRAIPRLFEMIKPSERAKNYINRLAYTLDSEGYHTDAKIIRESIKAMDDVKVSMTTVDKEPISKFLEDEISRCILDEDMNFENCAHHFFELGLKVAQKGEEV